MALLNQLWGYLMIRYILILSLWCSPLLAQNLCQPVFSGKPVTNEAVAGSGFMAAKTTRGSYLNKTDVQSLHAYSDVTLANGDVSVGRFTHIHLEEPLLYPFGTIEGFDGVFLGSSTYKDMLTGLNKTVYYFEVDRFDDEYNYLIGVTKAQIDFEQSQVYESSLVYYDSPDINQTVH